MQVSCVACGKPREPSADELRSRSVQPCECGNGSYSGINWATFRVPDEEE